MTDEPPRGGEWHWLWEVYVVGLCAAAMIAVVLLNHRFPGNVAVAAVALAGIAIWVLVFGRRAAHPSSRPPVPNPLGCRARQAAPPNGNDWHGRFMTRWRRASPAS